MTLADEYTNSILTDNANRALQGNVAMRVIMSIGQFQAMHYGASLLTNLLSFGEDSSHCLQSGPPDCATFIATLP